MLLSRLNLASTNNIFGSSCLRWCQQWRGSLMLHCNIHIGHQRKCLTNFANKEECTTTEPEYLARVTQTAERLRRSVREYTSSYSNISIAQDLLGNKNMINQERDLDDIACTVSPPKIKLVGILATTSSRNTCGDNTIDTHGNEKYSEQISAICTADGIAYEPWRVPPTKEALERSIRHANERLDVHGILVFYPVFDKLTDVKSSGSLRGPSKCDITGVYYKSMDDYFRDLVSPQKDVEGYHRKALRVKNLECRDDDEETEVITSCAAPTDSDTTKYGPIYPCTALAVFRILESFLKQNNGIDFIHGDINRINKKCFAFANITMTIVNRSEVLGLPLATMLSNQGATIYSVDKNSILKFQPDGRVRREQSTTTVENCIRNSSVIVSGVPSDDFTIPTDWISDKSIVINVANNSNFDEASLIEKPSVTYVPHVGRVTVAALESNLICLHKNYH